MKKNNFLKIKLFQIVNILNSHNKISFDLGYKDRYISVLNFQDKTKWMFGYLDYYVEEIKALDQNHLLIKLENHENCRDDCVDKIFTKEKKYAKKT